jgi:hypothetical protein
MSALWLALRQGYDRRSAAALALALCTYGAVGYHWRNLIRPELGMDWLLAGIWIFMTGLLCWRLQPREDLRLVLVGLCGGAVIEWWGTTTELWRYFTAERPPPWIIPAWPVAALTIHRLPALLRPLWPGLDRLSRLYYPLMLGFFVLMARFLWPSVYENARSAGRYRRLVCGSSRGHSRYASRLYRPWSVQSLTARHSTVVTRVISVVSALEKF